MSGGSSSSQSQTIYETNTPTVAAYGVEGPATVVSAAKDSVVNVLDGGAIREAFAFASKAADEQNKAAAAALQSVATAGDNAMKHVSAAVNPGADTTRTAIYAASIVAAVLLITKKG